MPTKHWLFTLDMDETTQYLRVPHTPWLGPGRRPKTHRTEFSPNGTRFGVTAGSIINVLDRFLQKV